MVTSNLKIHILDEPKKYGDNKVYLKEAISLSLDGVSYINDSLNIKINGYE